jgi:hypothetical protein
MTDSEIFTRYGYDPDDPVRGLDIPDRLIEDLELENDEDSE